MTDRLPEPGTDSFLPTRQSLLSRLRDCQDQAGWREFFDESGNQESLPILDALDETDLGERTTNESA